MCLNGCNHIGLIVASPVPGNRSAGPPRRALSRKVGAIRVGSILEWPRLCRETAPHPAVGEVLQDRRVQAASSGPVVAGTVAQGWTRPHFQQVPL